MTSIRIIPCIAVLFLMSACETIPQQSKLVAVSISGTDEATLPLMTPMPRCDVFLSNIELAEQKTTQPHITDAVIDAL